MDKIQLKALAKINLVLDVLRRREVVSLIFCCNFKMHNNFLVFHVVTIFFLLYVTARRNTRNNHGLKCFFSSYR